MRMPLLAIKQWERSVKQTVFLALAVAPFAAAMPVYALDDGAESIEVSCYKKEAEEGLYVGNVSTTRPETAAVNCNATYFNDCKDKCIGCFTDQKLDQTVCYNAAGEKVQQ